jgi:rhamnose utilization protein RhaD (predicted bifunctional aldolase and dehydrogenase)
MPQTLFDELPELARTLGAHPSRLVIWNEGSCAVKTSAHSYRVTVAGANLAGLKRSDSVEFDLAKMTELVAADLTGEEELAAARILPEETAPPSTDALLYAYLLGFEGVTMAAHVHPVEINQITCSPRARQFADRRSVPNEITAFGSAMLLVPYADPGLQLAKEVKRRMLLWRDRYKTVPKVVLIHNHGMIVLGDSPVELLKTIETTLKAAQVFIGASMLGGPVFLTPNNVTHLEPLKEL